ncbi:MAG: transposase [Rubrivivax sp.]|nr:transposase [Rubrivivax sp.]
MHGTGFQIPGEFLKGWSGTLTCDDYGGYDVVFKREGCIEAGCLAHARRKFDELAKANASPVAAHAIATHRQDLPGRGRGAGDGAEARLAHRRQCARPLWDELHAWMKLERSRVPDGSGIAGALDYSLKRWAALGRFLGDGAVSVDNNHIENLMRPWAMGRNNANGSLMRTRLRRRAIPPSVEAPTATLLLRMITVTAGTASTPWAGGSELA